MKKLKTKWLIWTSKVFVSAISMLGFSSCWFQPCMYGVPRDNWEDSTATDSRRAFGYELLKRRFKAMYGVAPAPYRQVDIDKEGVEIEIKQD